MHWKIERFHRKIKQLTGIERNQCRTTRIKHGLMADYLRQQLKNPAVTMRFA